MIPFDPPPQAIVQKIEDKKYAEDQLRQRRREEEKRKKNIYADIRGKQNERTQYER